MHTSYLQMVLIHTVHFMPSNYKWDKLKSVLSALDCCLESISSKVSVLATKIAHWTIHNANIYFFLCSMYRYHICHLIKCFFHVENIYYCTQLYLLLLRYMLTLAIMCGWVSSINKDLMFQIESMGGLENFKLYVALIPRYKGCSI